MMTSTSREDAKEKLKKNLEALRLNLSNIIKSSKFQFEDDVMYPLEYDGYYQGAPCTYIIHAPDENQISAVDVRFKNPVHVETFKVTILKEGDINEDSDK